MFSGMAKASVTPIWLYRYGSLARIVADGLPLRATCRKCRVPQKVDVRVLQALHTSNWSPVDQLASCRIASCDGLVFFQGKTGEGSPWRPLLTKAD